MHSIENLQETDMYPLNPPLGVVARGPKYFPEKVETLYW